MTEQTHSNASVKNRISSVLDKRDESIPIDGFLFFAIDKKGVTISLEGSTEQLTMGFIGVTKHIDGFYKIIGESLKRYLEGEIQLMLDEDRAATDNDK